jgi:hypothetical protein
VADGGRIIKDERANPLGSRTTTSSVVQGKRAAVAKSDNPAARVLEPYAPRPEQLDSGDPASPEGTKVAISELADDVLALIAAGASTGPVAAADVGYDDAQASPTLGASDVQQAIDALKALLGTGGGGPSSSGIVAGKADFTFATGSPMTLLLLMVADVIDVCAIIVETPFNDPAASVQLGTVAAPGNVFGPGETSLAEAGAQYNTQAKVKVTLAEVLRLTINPGVSTQGSGTVLFSVRR